MNDQLESYKDTIRDHPTETAAAVGVVTVLCTIFYFKSKENRKRDTTPCRHKHDGIGWFSRWLEYRKTRLELKLASIKRN